ncbi:MAG: hypothetical protein J0I42_14920 [Bosea sp.]|uniref:hypothetical protein n=1 Tax=Bosea sp. (in: a-proteobacteria) TaxID=1871050 RepID=UPI001AC078D6|nr:hypothetical protein [Bosea sp. (in: a-proteobacteria)]MBN9453238.1 hypothetical protein [Bosea sp. (in: a-proteobacteria)]
MTTVPRDFGASPIPGKPGFTAWFMAPGVGFRTVTVEGVVTRENGKPIAQVFDTEVEAMLAAARAKDRAEDRGRPPLSKAAKVFKTAGTGRNRRAIAI